jgi:hypothetical protein
VRAQRIRQDRFDGLAGARSEAALSVHLRALRGPRAQGKYARQSVGNTPCIAVPWSILGVTLLCGLCVIGCGRDREAAGGDICNR